MASEKASAGTFPVVQEEVLFVGVNKERWSIKSLCTRIIAFLIVAATLFSWDFELFIRSIRSLTNTHASHDLDVDVCPQASPLKPTGSAELLENLESLYQTKDFRLHADESLGGIVRIP